MLGRRRVLTGMLGIGAVGLGGMPGGAQSAAQVGARPESGADAAPAVRRENCSFLNEARTIFADDIARGVVPANSDRTVFCPLCQQNLTLKRSASAPA